MSDPLPIPLLYNGDYLSIDVDDSGPFVRILRILVYVNNENVEPQDVKFFDLPPQTRHAVVAQVQARYKGRTVKI